MLGDLRRAAWPIGWNCVDTYPLFREDIQGVLERVGAPPESACETIVDEIRLPVALDSTLIIVDARQ